MKVQPPEVDSNFVREQLSEVREAYPEQFAYLRQRDAILRRTLLWIPHPNDPEAYMGMDRLEHLLDDLRRLPPGIVDLARE